MQYIRKSMFQYEKEWLNGLTWRSWVYNQNNQAAGTLKYIEKEADGTLIQKRILQPLKSEHNSVSLPVNALTTDAPEKNRSSTCRRMLLSSNCHISWVSKGYWVENITTIIRKSVRKTYLVILVRAYRYAVESRKSMEQSTFPAADPAEYQPVNYYPAGSIPHDECPGVCDRPICFIQCNLLFKRLDIKPYPGYQMAKVTRSNLFQWYLRRTDG